MRGNKTLINSNMFYKVIDLFNLLLVMFLSYSFFGSVLFGLCLYVFLSLIIMSVQIFVRSKNKVYSRGITLVVLLLTLCSVILISVNKESILNLLLQENGISLFILTVILLLRGLITNDLICKVKSNTLTLGILRFIFHSLFTFLLCDYLIKYFNDIELIISLIVVLGSSISMILVQLLNKDSLVNINDLSNLNTCYSYKIFSRSLFFTYLGFYLSAMMFVVNLSLDSNLDLVGNYLSIAFYFIIGTIISFIFYRMISKKHIYEGVYTIGFILNFVSNILLGTLKEYNFWLIIPWLIGASFMFTSIKSIQKKLILLNEFDGLYIDREMLLQDKTAKHNISLGLSLGISLIYIYLGDISFVKYVLSIFGLIIIVLGLYYVLKQPIDKDTYPLLEKYNKKEYEVNFENKIRRLFIDKYKRRFVLIFLRRVVKLAMNYKIVGQENVKDNLPAIFVSNHGEYYGPVVAVANMPYSYRPWIESQLLEVEKGYPYTYKYTFSLITWLPVFMRKFLAKTAVKLTSTVFTAFNPIPVYRSELRSIFKTFNLSVEALKEGDSVLIFPESTHNTEDGKYAKGGQVGDFFTGFAHVGVKYYEETGKSVCFYPIYLHKKKRQFIIGEPLKYNPNNERGLEKKRIAEELKSAMEDLRDDSK